jgi:putative hydrolase of the HAD superfamily
MSSDHFQAVCFDAGNTLLFCDPSPAAIYAEHLSRHGRTVRPEEVGPVFRDAWAEMQQRSATGQDRYGSVGGDEKAWWGGFVRKVLRRLDHDAHWEILLDELYAAFARPEVWKAFPDAHQTLDALRTRGIALAVISNWDRRLPKILDDLRFTELFDTVTVSSIEGCEKPAGEIFSRTLDRLGTSPERTIHIGDSPLEDYRGAEDAGLTAILIDRHERFEDRDFRRITTLSEVLELVES